ncbi:conserved hypothetical protein [Beggiatoa sp. PS]|nr:conserved hypothetical protein [Beggiatoa sp. PS]
MPNLTISNTSPLLYLHSIGQLQLLHLLYQNIVIPKAVQSELAVGANQGISVPDPLQINWISVISVQTPAMIPIVTDLGQGESEVIALALENPGSRMILDDLLARRIATANNMHFTGTLGIILKAKQVGHIHEVKPYINALRNAGLWISETLIHTVLTQANEI